MFEKTVKTSLKPQCNLILKQIEREAKNYTILVPQEYLTSNSYIDTFGYFLLGGVRHRVKYGLHIPLLYFSREQNYETYDVCLNRYLGAQTFVHQEYQFLKS